MNCIFCKIINGEVPSYTVYEDDVVKVILDINPVTNGDSLIITKKHFDDRFGIDSSTLLHVMEVVKKLYPTFQEKLNVDGLTLVNNNGYGQDVKHYHLHFTPRYKDDGIKTLSDKANLKSLDEINKLINEKE